MRLEVSSCPLCQGSRHELAYETRDWLRPDDPTLYTVVTCAECSLRFVNPRPSLADIPSLYPPDYYSLPAAPAQLLTAQQRVNREKAAVVERHCCRGRLLDVGCQRGEFLEHMRQRGWEVEGVELNTAIRVLPGLSIHRTSLADARLPTDAFDVVTLWSVIEHVPDVGSDLAEVLRVLRPGGLLVLLTTNYQSIPSRILKLEDAPRHLTLFTKRTLGRLLAAQGFLVEQIACSDRISRNSAYGMLQYLLARARGDAALERFYRGHFATSFAPGRTAAERFHRLRRLGFFKAGLVAGDRALGFLLDHISLVVGTYGTILATARKPTSAVSCTSKPHP
jgi:SAM-dependent methyltransferase